MLIRGGLCLAVNIFWQYYVDIDEPMGTLQQNSYTSMNEWLKHIVF